MRARRCRARGQALEAATGGATQQHAGACSCCAPLPLAHPHSRKQGVTTQLIAADKQVIASSMSWVQFARRGAGEGQTARPLAFPPALAAAGPSKAA